MTHISTTFVRYCLKIGKIDIAFLKPLAHPRLWCRHLLLLLLGVLRHAHDEGAEPLLHGAEEIHGHAQQWSNLAQQKKAVIS
jgi:hypothetical protein